MMLGIETAWQCDSTMCMLAVSDAIRACFLILYGLCVGN